MKFIYSEEVIKEQRKRLKKWFKIKEKPKNFDPRVIEKLKEIEKKIENFFW